MTKEEVEATPPEQRLGYYIRRIASRASSKPNKRKLKRWVQGVVHAAFELHPELREEKSLERYFVAKAGRKMGFRGEDLSWFVEKSYETGMAEQFIPPNVKAGILNPKWPR